MEKTAVNSTNITKIEVVLLKNKGKRPVHKIFTENPDFPLAFLTGLGYYILALGEMEC